MPGFGEPGSEVFLEGVTGVIRSDSDSHYWRQGSHRPTTSRGTGGSALSKVDSR
jgi:hypothetical protein